jgi:tRNA A37 threonylcarbamoyltransferase TsaD
MIIAFTQAPGLIGSLLVGAQFAKSLALALGKPLWPCIICRRMCWPT